MPERLVFFSLLVVAGTRVCAADGGPSPFGIASSGESFGDHPRLFPLLRQAGIGAVRSFPEWAGLQPERGRWDWSAADAVVASARKNGLELAGILAYLAPWASSAAPGETDHGKRTRTFPIKDMQDWRDFVAGVTSRYRNDIRCWEVYNEFNSAAFNRGGTPRDYADMVRQAYLATRKAAPECKLGIGCADVDLSFLEQAIAEGAGGCFDFVSVHPYSLMAAVMQGREPVFLAIAANLRKMLRKTFQRPDIALWVSEIGLPTTDTPQAEARQAQAIAKAYILCLAQGFERVFWFEGRGPTYGPEGDFGILRKAWTPRPAYQALSTMTGLLGHRPETLGWLNPTGHCYAFVFQGASGPVLAAWAATDKGDTLRFPTPVSATGLEGKTLEPAQDIALTRTPLFITALPEQWVAQARANADRPSPWLKDYSAAESVSCQTGAANVESGLSLLELPDGKTVLGLLDGIHARRTDKANKMNYIYFDVDDSYASVGDAELDITLVARRVDAAAGGGCNLLYESATGYRRTADWWTIPPEPGWHRHTFRLKDANFANNWGWNFRIDVVSSPGDIWLKEATVRRLGPKR